MANDSLLAHEENPYPYGFCPVCGCHGKTRERRPNGNDICALNHVYPSRDALPERPRDLRTLIKHRIARFENDIASRAGTTMSDIEDAAYARALEYVVGELRLALNDSASHNDPQAHEVRVSLLETEMRRLNNAMRHLRERLRAQVMEEGLRAILNAPLPPHIGPAHQLQGIARRTLSRLLPVQGSSDVGFALSTPDVDAARDAALEEAAKVAEAVDPEKPGNWLHARHKIAFAIRALRGAA